MYASVEKRKTVIDRNVVVAFVVCVVCVVVSALSSFFLYRAQTIFRARFAVSVLRNGGERGAGEVEQGLWEHTFTHQLHHCGCGAVARCCVCGATLNPFIASLHAYMFALHLVKCLSFKIATVVKVSCVVRLRIRISLQWRYKKTCNQSIYNGAKVITMSKNAFDFEITVDICAINGHNTSTT